MIDVDFNPGWRLCFASPPPRAEQGSPNAWWRKATNRKQAALYESMIVDEKT